MSSAASPAGGTAAALLLANVRYWPTVAPIARRELRRWRLRAQAIPDPVRREAATAKLFEERLNVEVAATQATLAAPRRRGDVTRAIVALQVAYDYLDLLTEAPERAADSERLLRALQAAFDPRALPGGTPTIDGSTADGSAAGGSEGAGDGEGCGDSEGAGDGAHSRDPFAEDPYLAELLGVVSKTLDGLPAAASVRDAAGRTAGLCVRAQALRHAAEQAPPGSAAERELWRWATVEGREHGLEPFELIAGASGSVLGLHALIAAAADPRTDTAVATRIERLYLLISVLTVLDSLLDASRDARQQKGLHLGRRLSQGEIAQRLTAVARRAGDEARAAPHAAHHRLTLAGVIAYYASAPEASEAGARVAIAQLREALGAALTPTLLTLRAWRAAKGQLAVSCRLSGRRRQRCAQGIEGGGDAEPAGAELGTSVEGGC